MLEAENRLEHFNRDRARILAEVERRILADRVAAAAAGGDASLEYVLNDVAYAEMRRLEDSHSRSGQKQLARWQRLAHRLTRMSEDTRREELARLIRFYAHDIVGNFDPRVYRFASDILPPALSFLSSPVGSLREGVAALGEFSGRIEVQGPLEHLRACCDRGTLVVTPTHSSNMDSIVIALALTRAQLPPVTYGAGKNLFSNPLISFFMRNLGAYRVDRRLRFELYKDVLKEYSTVLLENGYHSLFFPGGTRGRSNMVERRLKLGLLGTTIKAYTNNVSRAAPLGRFFIVPATINYRLVLEAETLIDDFLAEEGKSRYIIEDDEFSRIGRIVEFARKALALEESVVIRFGTPLDPFGNDVDDRGDSFDQRGRRVDPASYLRDADGAVSHDAQRGEVYTRLLGDRLVERLRRETVLLSTSLVTRVVFDEICAVAGTRDVYRLLRLEPSLARVPLECVRAGVERLRDRIEETPQWGRLHNPGRSAAAIVEDAVRGLVTYHARPVLRSAGRELLVGDMKLLYYYQNRTAHIPVERVS